MDTDQDDYGARGAGALVYQDNRRDSGIQHFHSSARQPNLLLSSQNINERYAANRALNSQNLQQ